MEQQVMWSTNGQTDDFLNSVNRTGKLPEFQRFANFTSQSKNTHFNANYAQVRRKFIISFKKKTILSIC
jgi:hypothetical protein